MNNADKLVLLTLGADLSGLRCLEVGPRDAPLFVRPTHAVSYADYADTDTLRTNLHGPGMDPSALVEVDIVTGGGRLCDATRLRFDAAVASHVVEHVPDLLGWLADMHDALVPGGTLGLAIPDKRFTFDHARTESTIAEAVEAWLMGYQRPSPRQVFDSAWQSFDITVEQAWRGAVPEAGALAVRQKRLRPALELVQRMHAAGTYTDAHCWVFTPDSFCTLMEQARLVGLMPFAVEAFHATVAGGYEFYVVLRRTQEGSGSFLKKRTKKNFRFGRLCGRRTRV